MCLSAAIGTILHRTIIRADMSCAPRIEVCLLNAVSTFQWPPMVTKNPENFCDILLNIQQIRVVSNYIIDYQSFVIVQ